MSDSQQRKLNPVNKEHVRAESRRVRKSLENSDLYAICPEAETIIPRSFPRGCCGNASDLLATYFMRQHGVSATYVNGWLPGVNQSHGWIEIGKLIVDITADQFDDVDEAVIVTTDYTWHSKFSDVSRRENASIEDAFLRGEFERVYGAMIQLLPPGVEWN